MRLDIRVQFALFNLYRSLKLEKRGDINRYYCKNISHLLVRAKKFIARHAIFYATIQEFSNEHFDAQLARIFGRVDELE